MRCALCPTLGCSLLRDSESPENTGQPWATRKGFLEDIASQLQGGEEILSCRGGRGCEGSRGPKEVRMCSCSGPREGTVVSQVGEKAGPGRAGCPGPGDEGQGLSFSSEYADVKQVGAVFEPKEQNFL